MVNDPKTFDLVNRGIDGELSARQMARLAKLRAENRDVETMYVETAAVADRVQSLGTVAPPEYLKSRIMRSLPVRAQPVSARATVRRSYLAGLAERVQFALQAQPALRLATVFVGGVFLGGILMTVAPLTGGVESSDVMGTMGADTPRETLPEAVVATFDEVFVGTAELTRIGDRVSLLLEGVSSSRISVEILVSPTQADFVGFADQSTRSAQDRQVEISGGAGRVALSVAGDVALALDFASSGATPAEFTITLVEADAVVSARDLSI
jgi:hypothetical protein